MIPVLLFHGADFFVMLALRQSIQGGEFFPCGLPQSYQERWDFSKSSTLMGAFGGKEGRLVSAVVSVSGPKGHG